jgi:hypothetical protein
VAKVIMGIMDDVESLRGKNVELVVASALVAPEAVVGNKKSAGSANKTSEPVAM